MEKRDEKNSATGNEQSSFAGTNPNKYGDPKPIDDSEYPIADEEAQNVKDGPKELSGEEAQHATNKANQRSQQEGGNG
jgi:hypothetical protein